MAARILDGKAIAAAALAKLAPEVAELKSKSGVVPHLVAVLVGDDPASKVYVRNKERACAAAGVASTVRTLPGSAATAELSALLADLNADRSVHGILVQLPLPAQFDERLVLLAIDPAKDVDCFHPFNVGLVAEGRPRFLPCTPAGVLEILRHEGIATAGADAVVVGRSNIVGKPVAQLLLARHATVTIAHSRTRDLPAVCREADVLVVAVGKAQMIDDRHVREGAVVIDVGINRTDAGLTGDVEYEGAAERARLITPVPGGVGPMTIAMLLRNAMIAARAQTGEPAWS